MSVDVENISARSGRIEDREVKLPSPTLLKQHLTNLQERISPPELFIPNKDYSQKDSIESEELCPNLSLYMMIDSKRAREAWVPWLEQKIQEHKGEKNVHELLLEPEDLDSYKEFEKEVKMVEEEIDRFERGVCQSIISSTPKILGSKIPDLKDVGSGRTIHDLLEFQQKSHLEISTRPSIERDSDFSFLDPKSDPDFVPPLSHSNKRRGGFVIGLASRPYNLEFGITYTDTEGKKRFKRSRPKCAKDYTTEDDIEFLLESKKIKDYTVKVLTPEEKVRFEYDLRISPRNEKIVGEDGSITESLIPNPTNYKKIDCDTPVGQRLVLSLKENPYHEWTEVSWKTTILVDVEGRLKPTEVTKAALVRKTKTSLYWIYIDDKEIGGYKTWTKVIYPQITTIYDKTVKTQAKYIIGYKIRSSDYEELEFPYNERVYKSLSFVIDNIITSGFVFASKSAHDVFGAIVYSFVRSDLTTNKLRYLERQSD